MSNSQLITIDLAKFQTKGSKVFSGRDRGLDVRKESGIDKYFLDSIKKGFKLKIIIPEDIFSINPSFLEEFLQTGVLNLKKDGFHKHVQFENNGEFKIDTSLETAIDRILRKSNSLMQNTNV